MSQCGFFKQLCERSTWTGFWLASTILPYLLWYFLLCTGRLPVIIILVWGGVELVPRSSSSLLSLSLDRVQSAAFSHRSGASGSSAHGAQNPPPRPLREGLAQPAQISLSAGRQKISVWFLTAQSRSQRCCLCFFIFSVLA